MRKNVITCAAALLTSVACAATNTVTNVTAATMLKYVPTTTVLSNLVNVGAGSPTNRLLWASVTNLVSAQRAVDDLRVYRREKDCWVWSNWTNPMEPDAKPAPADFLAFANSPGSKPIYFEHDGWFGGTQFWPNGKRKYMKDPGPGGLGLETDLNFAFTAYDETGTNELFRFGAHAHRDNPTNETFVSWSDRPVNEFVRVATTDMVDWNLEGKTDTNDFVTATNDLWNARGGGMRIYPKYLEFMEVADTYPEEAEMYYDQAFGPAACSSYRDGGFHYRNYDWNFDSSCVFVVSTLAGPGRFASIGVGGVGTNLTEEIVSSGERTKWYKAVPGHMLDGINERGVCVNINVISSHGHTNGWHGVPSADGIHCLAGVRWTLDNATNAQHAATELARRVYVPQAALDKGYSFHYMVSDEDSTWIVEDGWCSNFTGRVAMTNVRSLDANDPCGTGRERLALLNDGKSITDVWYTKAYTDEANKRLSEFVVTGTETTEELTAAWQTAHDLWIAKGREEHRGERPGGQNWWQTVHTAVYDLANRSVRVCVQEDANWYSFQVPSSGSGGGEDPMFSNKVARIVQDFEKCTYDDSRRTFGAGVYTWRVWRVGEESNWAPITYNDSREHEGLWSGKARVAPGTDVTVLMDADWNGTNTVWTPVILLPPSLGGGEVKLPEFTGTTHTYELGAPFGTVVLQAQVYYPYLTDAEVGDQIDYKVRQSEKFDWTRTTNLFAKATNLLDVTKVSWTLDSDTNYTALTVGLVATGGAAPGPGSVAIGVVNTVTGAYSIASGLNTVAGARFSHADGYATLATNIFSYAWAGSTNTMHYGSHGHGTFNVNPQGGIEGFWIGETNLASYIRSGAADPTRITSEDGRKWQTYDGDFVEDVDDHCVWDNKVMEEHLVPSGSNEWSCVGSDYTAHLVFRPDRPGEEWYFFRFYYEYGMTNDEITAEGDGTETVLFDWGYWDRLERTDVPAGRYVTKHVVYDTDEIAAKRLCSEDGLEFQRYDGSVMRTDPAHYDWYEEARTYQNFTRRVNEYGETLWANQYEDAFGNLYCVSYMDWGDEPKKWRYCMYYEDTFYDPIAVFEGPEDSETLTFVVHEDPWDSDSPEVTNVLVRYSVEARDEKVGQVVYAAKSVYGDYDAYTFGQRDSNMDVGAASVSIGLYNSVQGNSATAIGENNEAAGVRDVAVGYHNILTGSAMTSIGMGLYTRSTHSRAFTWSAEDHNYDGYRTHGDGTFNVNPDGGLDGIWVGDRRLTDHLSSEYRAYTNLEYIVTNAYETFTAWTVFDASGNPAPDSWITWSGSQWMCHVGPNMSGGNSSYGGADPNALFVRYYNNYTSTREKVKVVETNACTRIATIADMDRGYRRVEDSTCSNDVQFVAAKFILYGLRPGDVNYNISHDGSNTWTLYVDRGGGSSFSTTATGGPDALNVSFSSGYYATKYDYKARSGETFCTYETMTNWVSRKLDTRGSGSLFAPAPTAVRSGDSEAVRAAKDLIRSKVESLTESSTAADIVNALKSIYE